MTWAGAEGLPYPLGVSVADDGNFNFAVYSKHATSVRLLLFDAHDVTVPRAEYVFDPSTNKTGRIWHCRLDREVAGGCCYYGFIVDGPEPIPPHDVHSFVPHKLLLDPYARSIVFPPGFDRAAAIDSSKNIGKAPLGAITACDPRFDWGTDRAPSHEADAIIYELHVRGFTQHPSSGVSDAARGTFAGVVEKIPYLRELGVTVVELMPVFQSDPQGRDRWGYMPLGFFAPQNTYASHGRPPAECFRDMVKALHAAGIEVVLDVVYNHTAEAGAGGPSYSFKGLDNSTYYLMQDGRYADFSGCGNSLNANNRFVRKMIVDSMRYWVREMHVDGFRFDLASVFARRSDGSIAVETPAIFGEIASDPLFDGVRMIAEPWDATGASALGRAFPGVTWLQWNSGFRDDIRRFVRGDDAMTGAAVRRIYGSDDLFPDDRLDAYHAYQSVNYVTSHDGFTLHDLVSFSRKRNIDGAADELSHNHGHEGVEGAPAGIAALREQQAKNFLALLMLSNGTPMLRAGDEFLHTQQGHNNPYDLDDDIVWLDWRNRDARPEYWRFVQQLIAFRKRHPSIARSRFWRDDVRWYGPRGVVDFASPRFAWCLHGASQGDRDLYVMVNAGAAPTTFVLQDTATARWSVIIDTSRPSPDDIDIDRSRELERPSYAVAPRSVVVCVR